MKRKIAFYWCSSCGGCEESVIDLAEELLSLAEAWDIVFWPIALDFKHKDVRTLEDGAVWATFINGAIRMDEQEEMARLLRRKSRILIAHGSCAHLGGVYGLSNFFTGREVLDRSYGEVSTTHNPQGLFSQVVTVQGNREPALPRFRECVKPLDRVVDVDYTVPGCPPTPELIENAMTMIFKETLPPKGSVLAAATALCDTCPRRDSRSERVRVKKFRRLHETEWDPEKCFLDQGIICLGPATRGGCGARCIRGNMPCRGCFGPMDKVMDQGAKSLSFIAALMDDLNANELKKAVHSIPDPAGLFYRYSLPSSILKEKTGK